MKSGQIFVSALAALSSAASVASAVSFEWITVGAPGNACDPQGPGRCFGAVDYIYRIAKHEVSNAQYVEFLNKKAASDPLGLYNTDMGTWGGITRSGSPGSYAYSAIPGRENHPVNSVSYFDALRFINWLHNGQGNGDTETGAYTLLGGTATPSNTLVERNPGATIFLPTDAEWYKAAYYDTVAGIYYDYPAGTDAQIVPSAPTSSPNTANCAGAAGASRAWGVTAARPAPTAPSTRAATSRSGATSSSSSTIALSGAGTQAAPRTVSEDRSRNTTTRRTSSRAPASALQLPDQPPIAMATASPIAASPTPTATD